MIDDFSPGSPSPRQPLSDNPDETNIQEPDFYPPEKIDKTPSYSVSAFSRDTNTQDPVESIKSPVKKDFSPASGEKRKQNKKFSFRFPELSKKQWLIIATVALVLVSGGGALAWKLTHKAKTPAPTPVVEKKVEAPKPKVYTSKLTGMAVTQPESELPVTAVMIENSPDARPQAGLKDAGVVYEAVAEGGITRFLTLFQEAQPNYLGPVRSVRPYYLDWLVPFDAAVAHVGGSGEALEQLRGQNLKDLDYAFNSTFYHRVSNRYAPHNVYTSRAELLQLQKNKGWTTSTFTGWTRKDETPSTAPNAKSIDFSISGFLYNPHYDYDAASNSYQRSEAGKPHVDEKTGQQIAPKVIIAMILPKSIHPDGVHTVYGTLGTGKAYVFQDGTVTVGTWEKKDRKGEMVFKLANGTILPLNKGNTWISAVELEGSITYKP